MEETSSINNLVSTPSSSDQGADPISMKK